VVVEMNLVTYSWQRDRVSHVLIVSDSSGIVRVKFHVVMGVSNVHFIALSHGFRPSKIGCIWWLYLGRVEHETAAQLRNATSAAA